MNVEQDGLERAVREELSRRAAMPHATVPDPADAVIRRAKRIQRRRAVTGMSFAAVAMVMVSAGATQLGQEPPPNGTRVVIGEREQPPEVTWTPTVPAPSPANGTPLAEVDLVLGEAIATAQGRRVSIAGVGRIERAHRLADGRGWLVVSAPGLAGRFLWAVSPTGAVQVLLAGADEIVVDAEGHQVAWKQGSVLASARIINGELSPAARAEVPAEAMPLRIVEGAVLVRLAPDRPGHALWRLHPGVFEPGTDRSTSRIFGALPDGRLVGEVVTGTATCLTLLDPAGGLAPTGPECGPRLDGDGLGSVSPDGRWLLANGRSDDGDKALLVDLARLDRSVKPVVAGPAISGAVAWSTPSTAYYHADTVDRLARVDVDRATKGASPTLIALTGWPPDQPPVVVSHGG
ncbi:hypothetical protein [Verrucosispora sp. FIM060022]|uniref:hypothetical protein n=1 Tax=Verrucosispora sp. FIM060022 TaxID=1479020 RepID=UPI000F89179C|nr:hypothetical protein [Verrucosispora sp. FIM060022]RUL92573.1 hypothetical protein EG812_14210 [Verrucosispora sp. FIM060022]